MGIVPVGIGRREIRGRLREHLAAGLELYVDLGLLRARFVRIDDKVDVSLVSGVVRWPDHRNHVLSLENQRIGGVRLGVGRLDVFHHHQTADPDALGRRGYVDLRGLGGRLAAFAVHHRGIDRVMPRRKIQGCV
jgi:hypothetical protein